MSGTRAERAQHLVGHVVTAFLAPGVETRDLEQRRCVRHGDTLDVRRFRQGHSAAAFLDIEAQRLERRHDGLQAVRVVLALAALCRTLRGFEIAGPETAHGWALIERGMAGLARVTSELLPRFPENAAYAGASRPEGRIAGRTAAFTRRATAIFARHAAPTRRWSM